MSIALTDITDDTQEMEFIVAGLTTLLDAKITEIEKDKKYWMPNVAENNPFAKPIKKAANWPPSFQAGCYTWNMEYIIGPNVQMDQFVTDGLRMYPNLQNLVEEEQKQGQDHSFERMYQALMLANPDLDPSKPVFTTTRSVIDLNQPDLASNSAFDILRTLYLRLETIAVSRTKDIS